MFKRISFVLTILTILLLGSSFSFASEKKEEIDTQIIMVLVNHLAFLDYPLYVNTVGFHTLEQSAAKGAMNINSAGSKTDSNAYLTISVSTRALSSKDIGDSFLGIEYVDEVRKVRAKDLYRQQTGRIVNDQTILFLSIQSLLQEENQKFPFVYGVLGDSLKQAGLQARVYGNQDIDIPKRYAPLLIMDKNGQSFGDVGKHTIVFDPARPYGVKTNYEYLYQRFLQDRNAGISLIVFDLGDLYRLDQFKKQMSIDQYQTVRRMIIQEQGKFIERLKNELNDNQQLLVFAPMVSDQAIEDRQLLAPIWWYNPKAAGNFLTSNTTKRIGIVSNVDIAPTILSLLGVDHLPSEMIGQSMELISSDRLLLNDLNQLFITYRQRPTVLYTFIFWQIILLILSMAVWFIKWKKGYRFMRIGLIGMLYLPLLLLVTSPFYKIQPWLYILLLFIISLLLGLVTRYKESISIFVVIGFLTWLGITLDLSMGAYFMKRSYLGYDPIIGARYYGIGNEYMGVYIGATLLFTSSIIHKKRNRWTLGVTALIYSVISYFLLAPTLGTNAGGAISALVATTFTFLQMLHVSFRKKGIWIFLALMVLGFSALICSNLAIGSDEQSHIGRALQLLTQGDFSSIYSIIARKLAMNWKLIQVSSWSKVMVTSLVVIGILFMKPRGAIKTFFEQSPYLFYGFYGIVVGAFIALLVNDSGIVAASTMIIFVASPMLYLALEEK
ncbi:hypothetical protein [Tepidibacillus fermentans]|uniref:Uncharacterized protein n=1 Tax=Tepidibacillus fermentans TaxID=1281767 RepID=A0A4R3KA98_9BACI|nr:hypothetical protein [Tepidibacillus fermentans]TCS79571.1 hypothetical protein EDD72_12030 [Tepidibacillus fermentans]